MAILSNNPPQKGYGDRKHKPKHLRQQFAIKSMQHKARGPIRSVAYLLREDGGFLLREDGGLVRLG